MVPFNTWSSGKFVYENRCTLQLYTVFLLLCCYRQKRTSEETLPKTNKKRNYAVMAYIGSGPSSEIMIVFFALTLN